MGHDSNSFILLEILLVVSRASPISAALTPHSFNFLTSLLSLMPLSLITILSGGIRGRSRLVVSIHG